MYYKRYNILQQKDITHFLPCKENVKGPLQCRPMIQKTPAGVGIAWTKRGQQRGQKLRSTSSQKWDLSGVRWEGKDSLGR